MTHANLAAVDALALVLGLTSTRCPLLLVIVVVTLICCLRTRFSYLIFSYLIFSRLPNRFLTRPAR